MTRALLCALLVGCGLPLTPNAVYCGDQLGLAVYTDADGGYSCPEALAGVQQARDLGAQQGFWAPDTVWHGYRVEFVDAPAVNGLDGETDSLAHEIAVIDTGFPQTGWLILMHELLHASYGEADHCNWSTRYEPSFMADKMPGYFVDECQHLHCNATGCI